MEEERMAERICPSSAEPTKLKARSSLYRKRAILMGVLLDWGEEGGLGDGVRVGTKGREREWENEKESDKEGCEFSGLLFSEGDAIEEMLTWEVVYVLRWMCGEVRGTGGWARSGSRTSREVLALVICEATRLQCEC